MLEVRSRNQAQPSGCSPPLGTEGMVAGSEATRVWTTDGSKSRLPSATALGRFAAGKGLVL